MDMTFIKFSKILYHYWIVLLLIPLVFGIAAAIYAFSLPLSYEAKSYITAVDLSGSMSAQNMASAVESYVSEMVQDEGFSNVDVAKVEKKIAAEMNSVAITVHGSSAEQCVQTVNEIASQGAEGMNARFALLREDFEAQKLTPEEASPLYGEKGDSWDYRIMQDLLTSDTLFRYCTFNPIYTTGAEKVGVNPFKLIIAAVLAGFVVAICVLACFAQIRQPLLGGTRQSAMFGLPVLNFGKGPLGESVVVSLKLLRKNVRSSICLVPLSVGYGDDLARQIAEVAAIQRASRKEMFTEGDTEADDELSYFLLEDDSPNIVVCDPLSENPTTAIEASGSAIVIVCAKCWKDSSTRLRETIDRLKSYGIDPFGLIVIG